MDPVSGALKWRKFVIDGMASWADDEEQYTILELHDGTFKVYDDAGEWLAGPNSHPTLEAAQAYAQAYENGEI